MTKASRKFVHHYAGVAIVVGLLSTFGTWTATRFVTASSAQSAPAAAKPLLVQPLADPERQAALDLWGGHVSELFEGISQEQRIELKIVA
jgi:hypothetical protein